MTNHIENKSKYKKAWAYTNRFIIGFKNYEVKWRSI